MKPTGQNVPGTSRHGPGRMLALVAAGVIAATGGIAVLLATSASPAPSALTVVTTAIEKTSADSYSFSLNSTVRFAGHDVSSSAVTGAFDPRHDLGVELLTMPTGPSEEAQIRFIGQYVYGWKSSGSRLGEPWDKAPAPPSKEHVGPFGFSTERPVSAGELLVVLRSVAAVRDEGATSGPGWTGVKYGFSARLNAQESVGGTVYVDQQGRVRRLMTTTTVRSPAPGTEAAITTDRELSFSDFGAPVSVTAPPARQVEYTSTPYWGFLF